MRKQAIIATLTVGVLFCAAIVQAGVERVRVKVDGLACPFCAYNIEKRVRTLDGVKPKGQFNVSVERGYAEFEWKADVEFDPQAVHQQVRKAGFTPRQMELTATGVARIERPDEDKPAALVLKLSESAAVQVTRPERADRVESYELLRKAASAEKTASVRAHGEVEADDGTWRLSLHRWEPTDAGGRVVFIVEDLACERCSTGVMRTLVDIKGVVHIEADHELDRIEVWTQAKPRVDEMRKQIEEAGFKVTETHHHHSKAGD